MNKTLVEVHVPAADKKFDVYIPAESKVHEVATLITKAINGLTAGKFKGDNSSILCDAGNGIILNVNITVAAHGIKNGSKLMLI